MERLLCIGDQVIDAGRIDEPPELDHTAVGPSPLLVSATTARYRHEDQASNTMVLMSRLQNSPLYRPPEIVAHPYALYGWFRERHLIGTYVPATNGTYMGRLPREAVVPARMRRGTAAWNAFWEFVEQRTTVVHGSRPQFTERLLPDLMAHLQAVMPYNAEIVRDVVRTLHVGPDEEVDVNEFYAAGGGVCRHQACGLAQWVEELFWFGLLHGRFWIERGFVPAVGGNHAWCRYTDPHGVVSICDPALNFCGTREELGLAGEILYGL